MQMEQPSHEAAARLSTLGIKLADIEHVGITMLEAAASAHPMGAQMEPGILRWSRGIAGFGEVLVPRRWRRHREDGCELITSPDGAVSIMVTAGDENVGSATQVPKARYPRGRATKRRIRRNALQMGIPGLREDEIEDIPENEDSTLWMLLHRTEEGALIVELGLPARIGEDSMTIEWEERLQLGKFGFLDDGDDRLGPPPTDPRSSGPIITIIPRQ